MSDLIDRQAAIDGKICIQRSNGVEIYDDYAVPVEYLEQLPPAQPERTPMQELLDVTADRDYWKAQCHSYEMTINRLTESAQPRREERKIGEWIYDWGDWDFETCKCSECGNHITTPIGKRYSFCPNCGADMREVTT